MKNAILFLVLTTFFLNSLAAQVEISFTAEQIVFLNDGTILKGAVEEIDRKTVRISKDNESFIIPKKNIEQTLVTDVTVGDDIEDTESLIIFKNKTWLKAQVFEASKSSILIKSGEEFKRLSSSDLFKLYPAGQEFEQSEKFLQKKYSDALNHTPSLETPSDQKKEKRIYNITTGIIKPRLTSIRDGLGIQHTTGFRINQYLGVGLSAGFTNYAHDVIDIFNAESGFCIDFCSFTESEIRTVSTGLSLRGELSKKKVRPFYNIDFGLTKTLRSDELNREIRLIENDPMTNLTYDKKASRPKLGYIFQPSFGTQIKMKSLDLLVDLGLQFGFLHFEKYGFPGVLPDQTFTYDVRDERIRGIVLRVGILL